MKKDINFKLERFKDAITPVIQNASFAKKKYLTDLFAEIIDEINFRENKNLHLEAQIRGFESPANFDNTFTKIVQISQCFGLNSVEFSSIRQETINLIIDNFKDLKTEMTWNKLINTNKMVCFFESLNDKYPENFDELKKFWEEVKNDKR